MGKLLAALFVFGLAAWLGLGGWTRLRAEVEDRRLSGAERVAKARALRGPAIRQRFAEAQLPYPPREIFLRAFKREAELELWARKGAEPFRLVTVFPVLASSGKPGPKRREGDRQVPEGFYRIDRFNPQSSYHLSLGIDYPNASDRVRSHREKPGGDIFIHGRDVTVGCLPLGDERIEELYLAALDAAAAGQRAIPVHIFPARMAGEEWERFRHTEAERDGSLAAFWNELQPVFDAFEKERRLPKIEVGPRGEYSVTMGR